MSRHDVGCLLALLAAACSVGNGSGRVSGALYVRECTKDGDLGTLNVPVSYNMQPTFFVAQPINDFLRPHPVNTASIRVQPTGNQIELADGLFINMESVRDVARSMGSSTEVGPTTNVRATLRLHSSCPTADVTGELDGSVADGGGLTFTAFGRASPGAALPEDFQLQYGDRLAAHFRFNLVDRRAITLGGVGSVPVAPAIAGFIEGDFDFRLAQGRAAQAYP